MRGNSRPGKSRAGVTLIEILIAVSLLSLLSVAMLVAMRIGLSTMDKTQAHLLQNRRVANARRIMENEFSGFIYSNANWRPAPQSFLLLPFQQWESQSVRFVTAYSLEGSWRGHPQIAALQVIPGENNQGVRLILNETPYTGPEQAGQFISSFEKNFIRFVPIVPGPQSFILADRLAYCRFLFLESLAAPPFQVWRPDWPDLRKLPKGIRIEMAPLDNRGVELHNFTVTVALKVDRETGAYSDAP